MMARSPIPTRGFIEIVHKCFLSEIVRNEKIKRVAFSFELPQKEGKETFIEATKCFFHSARTTNALIAVCITVFSFLNSATAGFFSSFFL